MTSIYLERYAYPKTYIDKGLHDQPDLIVVIPCFDEPELITSLNALEACDPPKGRVLILVVINASESSSSEVKQGNEETLKQCRTWLAEQRQYQYEFILENELPKKHAGVGLARKIGMDEAVRIFESQAKDGVILCFDADSTCETNLLVEVERMFQLHARMPGCSIHFEHPLSGGLEPGIYEGIINYELHLRYYVNGLRYAGFPYAFQTIGSSMAVRSSAYQKQGGMNRRKAGEDFYFLHKIIPLGGFRNLNSTKIIPSPRRSDRVPFGTGRAIGLWMDEGKVEYLTYNHQIYKDLKSFFSISNEFYKSAVIDFLYEGLPESIRHFIPKPEFIARINEFNTQANSLATFLKRFYQWFDGFKALKFVHFARDEHHQNIPISEGMDWLFNEMNMDSGRWDLKTKLEQLRRLDCSID